MHMFVDASGHSYGATAYGCTKAESCYGQKQSRTDEENTTTQAGTDGFASQVFE